MLGYFLKNRTPKQFNITPRYYNQDKEEFKKRYAAIESEFNGKKAEGKYSPRLKEKWLQNKRTTHFEKKSNLRLVIIATLLSAICYLLLFS